MGRFTAAPLNGSAPTSKTNGAFNGADAKQEFAAFAAGLGLVEPRGGFLDDGKLHRCDVTACPKDKKNSGSYQLFSNGVPAGWAQNWTDGAGPQTWCMRSESSLTDAERAEYRKRMEHAHQARKQEEAARHKEAAKEASRIWNSAKAAPASHLYLAKKGVKPHDLRLHDDGRLLVPLRDTENALHSLQFTDDAGNKRFLPGGRKQGLFFLIGDITPDGELLIGEGFATMASCHEATGLPAIVAFDCGNLVPVAQALRQKYPAPALTFCADLDSWTKARPGEHKAAEAAAAVGGRVAVPQFAGLRTCGETDFNDLHQVEGLDAVRRCIDAAAEPASAAASSGDGECLDVDAEVERLAGLRTLEYERIRETEAKRLGIKRLSALDDAVKQKRAQLAKASSGAEAGWGTAPEPWPEPVSGEALLVMLIEALRVHVILPDHAYLPVALWILHAHAHDAAAISPICAIISPEKRCGKTTLLSLLQELAPNPLLAANITAAAVYRAVEVWRPTLLVDEADTFLADREELRGVINSGHNRRSAVVIRVIELNGEQVPKKFSTWAPKAIAQIKDLPDTLQDRSIAIRLRRKLPGERVARFRADRTQHLSDINRRAARWAQDNLDALREMDVEAPAQLHDRAADNWRALLVIAERIGGEWPEKARAAALATEGVDLDAEADAEVTEGVRLLMDCKTVFEKRGASELSARSIIDDLCDMDESHWADYRAGRAITDKAFANLLKPYRITSKMGTTGSSKGKKLWHKEAFRDAWKRYLPAEGTKPANQTSTSSTLLKKKGNTNLQCSTMVEDGGGIKVNEIKAVEVAELNDRECPPSTADTPAQRRNCAGAEAERPLSWETTL